jgi:hypothetical protein
MPQRTGRALAYAVLIWITGFAWGSGRFYDALTEERLVDTLCLPVSCD